MPAAVPFIAMGAAAVGAGVSVYSAIRAGEEEEKAAKREARRERFAAAQRAEIKRKEHQRLIARQRARYGAAGLTMEGTPLLVQIESMRESEEELARILAGGEMYASEAERAGRAARRSGYVRGVVAGAGGVTTLARIRHEWF